MRRLLAWLFVGSVVVGAGACAGGEGVPTSEAEATEAEVAEVSVVATASVATAATGVATAEVVEDAEPLAWELPRGDEAPGVLLYEEGLVPLSAVSAEVLPGYRPFDLGRFSGDEVSPGGRWFGTSTLGLSSTAESGTLRLIDVTSWSELDLAEAGPEGELPKGLTWLVWSPDGERLYGTRVVGGRRDAELWSIDVGEPSGLLLGRFDFQFWKSPLVSVDGAVLYLFGYDSEECCGNGIDVEGAPYVVAVDAGDGRELGRVELPELVIGQQFERLFDNENEYNVLRYPAVALSPDGARMYVVHTDDDRVTVVNLDRLEVEQSVVVSRPKSAMSRLGSWVLGAFVAWAEAKGGVYRMKEAQVSPDGRLLYVTGVAEIACEEMNYFACVNGAPFGLQIIDLESMELVHEEPGIDEMVLTPDGRWLIGKGWETDRRDDENGRRVGYGVRILDARNGELVAHVEPELAARQLMLSPDGRFAYAVSEGPGLVEGTRAGCREDCTRIAVIEIERGEVVAERFLDSVWARLVSLVAEQ